MKGLEGNEAAQPRVFAHDAIQLDTSGSSGATYGFAKSLELKTDTAVGLTAPLEITNSAKGVVIRILSLKDNGSLATFDIVNPGAGCAVGDTLTFNGPTSGTITMDVEELGLPGTDERGACIFVGDKGGASGTGTMCVELESGKKAVFKGITSGSFLPVLARNILRQATDGAGSTATTDVTSVIALY
jgi:hypothetical protein